MKDIIQQLQRKCIHFNGLMNTCCKAGVHYSTVRVGKPYQLPCLKQAGECSSAQFRTEEEAKKEAEEIEALTQRTLNAYIKIKEHFQKTSENPGRIPCDCGGELKYTVARSNGHIWAMCNKCEIRFNE